MNDLINQSNFIEEVPNLPIEEPEEELYAICPKCFFIPQLKILPSQPDKIKITCQNCKFDDEVPLKYYIEQLKIDQSKEHMCESFEEHANNKAKIFCIQCNSWLCEECEKYHMKFSKEHQIVKGKVCINAKCTKHKEKDLESYCIKCKTEICFDCFPEHQRHQTVKLTNDDISEETITAIKEKLLKAEKILYEVNTKRKNCVVNMLKDLIQKIEKAYDSNLTKNKNLITFIKMMISNYKVGYLKYNTHINLLNNIDINFKSVDLSNKTLQKAIEVLIEYFKSQFVLSKQEVDLKQMENVQDYTFHKQKVNCLLLLRDGRIASAGSDQKIQIFDVQNKDPPLFLNAHSSSINSICQLSSGKIVSCSNDRTVKVLALTNQTLEIEKTITEHKSEVNKVISLSNERFASCSNDNTINIYNNSPPYALITSIQCDKGKVNTILQLKNKEILVSAIGDKTLIFWSLISYTCESALFGVECVHNNSIVQVDENRIALGHYKGIMIINTDSYSIVTTIKIDKFYKLEDLTWGGVSSMLILRDGNILVGCPDGGFYCVDIETYESSYKSDTNKTNSKLHSNSIADMINISDKSFLTCSYDGMIKRWNY